MFEIKFDEEKMKALFLEELNKRLDKLVQETYLMNSKQLCKMLSMSWPTVEKLFLYDPNFPSMRVGSKWLFHRKEVEAYIDKWAIKKKG